MSESRSRAAVIVAAGRGERVGSAERGPKQYRPIGGRAVISWTLETFQRHPEVGLIAVVVHPDDHTLLTQATETLELPASLIVVEGGADRQASVRRGLQSLQAADPDLVLIHDGVRPFVDTALINRVIKALRDGALAAVPAVAVADTLKSADQEGYVERTVPRAGLYAAQTPQGFAFEAILAAHKKAEKEQDQTFTDDGAIAEWVGMSVKLVAGDAKNIKLTYAEDLERANREMEMATLQAFPDIRTGNGYDVHTLVPGNAVTLCGIAIPHDQALSGHSDADVALHALTDALLATCGQGDIGDHFPPSDPQWKGKASHTFLEHAANLVAAAGGMVLNADVTLICEAPKIGPHKPAMREKLSEILGISVDRCSVKATTNEKVGFIGRREGIAAIATASVVYGAKPNG
ncbi:MAG: bifunctional 2-C-methyl-D-erythritol 4-phosphate cytidylyltransferase/2-C-methyl-D-erythritol 2,4-cyclodiphosphate synthase [Pseudomonadota bacterium]